MMSYEDNRNSVSCAAPGIQATGMQLSGMMTQGDNMAQEILNMAQKINVHMFGVSITDRDEAEPPRRVSETFLLISSRHLTKRRANSRR